LKIFLLLPLTLFGYSDADFDGVDDALDQCNNSRFDAIVNAKGCEEKIRFNLSAGYTYNSGTYGTTQTYITHAGLYSLSAYYKKFSLTLSNSYLYSGALIPQTADLNDTQAGFGDVYASAGYNFTLSSTFTLSTQGQIKLPTANSSLGSGELDYGASVILGWASGNWSWYGLSSFTFLTDSATTNYNNIFALASGIGYSIRDYYISTGYNYASAYQEGNDASQNLSFMLSYYFSDTMTSTLSYSYGLSNVVPDNSLSIMLGIAF